MYLFLISDTSLRKSISENAEWENESSGIGDDEVIGFDKTWSDSESWYSSDSSADSSIANSPIPDDTYSEYLFRHDFFL